MPAGESRPTRTESVGIPRQILQSPKEASCSSRVDVYHCPSHACCRAAANTSSWIPITEPVSGRAVGRGDRG